MSAHSHVHGPEGEVRPPDPAAVARRRTAVRLMLLVLVPVGIATLVGLVALWPSSEQTAAQRAAESFLPSGTTFPEATVASLETYECAAATGNAPAQVCAQAVLVVAEGESSGEYVQVELSSEVVAEGIEVGDELLLNRDPGIETGEVTYQFQDFPRSTPIITLALAFTLVVGAVARLRGLLALLGLGFAFFILLQFMLPGLLAGSSPIWVSLIGSSAIMYVVLYLAHGFNARTTTALLGTLFGLALSAVLGTIAVAAAHLTGLANEEAVQLLTFDPTLDFSGLVLAALVVAGLGILNDVTITQASAVWQLHEVSPEMGWVQLFQRGMAIGRDHIASTIYTIVFAYAGAALPLLLLFDIYERPFWTTLTGSVVGEEVVRTLVGGIALVLAVPVTTLIGALVAAAATSATPAAAELPADRTGGATR
ncbi:MULTISPECIES: YibE/F family protein [unclassified Modestobacter]|uniref:YibE/F family protein n=1 Tax=unclassified Modestobacter TaxID=2643866 RepID=UPI0022AAA893|nr:MULTISPECIES: YibE/F family protein [unclassified Modestobacter]MCZ2826548.1 YibE/F family protein [Modestobacter sp. VKM Ac-2981]MCZ2854928.1 YibE/F family protein [Modestobacter sp. VKM Ac-2982]